MEVRTAVMAAGILLNESHLLNPLGTGRQRRELEVADTEEQAQSEVMSGWGSQWCADGIPSEEEVPLESSVVCGVLFPTAPPFRLGSPSSQLMSFLAIVGGWGVPRAEQVC